MTKLPSLTTDEQRGVSRVMYERRDDKSIACVSVAVREFLLETRNDITSEMCDVIVKRDRAGECWCGCGRTRPEDVIERVMYHVIQADKDGCLEYLADLGMFELDYLCGAFGKALQAAQEMRAAHEVMNSGRLISPEELISLLDGLH